MILLGTSNSKTEMGEAHGYRTWALSLAPAEEAGGKTVCPDSTEGCREDCIFFVGRGPLPSVVRARVGRTRWFHGDRRSFLSQIVDDMEEAIGIGERVGLLPAFRLNCFSDVPWENKSLLRGAMDTLSDVWFYDYTKSYRRAMACATGKNWPENYHLTFSLSETNTGKARRVLEAGGPISAVFRTKDPKTFPKRFMGYPVINGDEHDLRFLGGAGPYVVGLTAKGSKAWNDTTGFVVNLNDERTKE